MDNFQIADQFSLLSKLMDIHGENSFKSKSYAITAFTIEKLPMQLKDLPTEKIASLKGIGSSSAQKIAELLESGHLKNLEEILLKTPPGVLEMLNIKGIGPKKISTIWKEMEIETVGELLYACKENRLKLYKGFGEKTQQSVSDTIEFYMKSKQSHLYAQVVTAAEQLEGFLAKIFPGKRVAVTGSFKRQLEIVNELEFVVESSLEELQAAMSVVEGFSFKELEGETCIYNTSVGIDVKLHTSPPASFIENVIFTSGSPEFLEVLRSKRQGLEEIDTEEQWFKEAHLPFIPACLRENPDIFNRTEPTERRLIQLQDIRGIIHSHSNWSDGSNSIEEMALAAIAKGLEYLVISDHSKSAFYANGLSEERIQAQHAQIDELNARLAPFRIFKSIESDILNDGSLDYPAEVLSNFDLVIASVHSNLKMSPEKAMSRLLRAVENPFTTILGHMTGRLLLSRPGYPVDHKAIIDACAANDVVIELNAHPNRLDIDWREISYALEKNMMISINPDAHFLDGLDDIGYGVLVAQKAMVTAKDNLSSLSLSDFEKFIINRKRKKSLSPSLEIQ